MADTLSERLRESEGAENGGPYRIVWEADVLEAAAELERREAIVAAAEAWAKAQRSAVLGDGTKPSYLWTPETDALLALLPKAN